MTTNNNTTTTTTARKRWTMYRRAMRRAAQPATCNLEPATFERLAAEWAGPYLGRFAQLSTSEA